MDKEARGAKRSCPSCKSRFYDLNQDPATCPECEHSFDIASLYQSDIRSAAGSKAKAAKEPVKDFDDVEVDEDLLDDDDDAITVDDDLLEDDDDSTVSIEEIADVATGDDE